MENLDQELKEVYQNATKDKEAAEEQKSVETEKTIEVEEKPIVEDKVITIEEKPAVIPAEEKQPTEVEVKGNIEETLPRGIKTSFNEDWGKLPQEFQKEVKRSLETKDNYIKTLEDKNTNLNKAIDIAEVQIQEVVKQTNLPREQVIGNMLSWVSACQVDADNTLCNALDKGAIQLKNPDGFIRLVANKYKINLNDLAMIDPNQAHLKDENARLKLMQEAQSKQTEYQSKMQEVEENRKIENSIESFKTNHQELTNELFSSSTFQSHMSYAIEKIKVEEPVNNDFLDIMEKAYKIIERDYTNNQQNNPAPQSANTANQATIIKKPTTTITKTTGLKSSTPTSRSVPKEYKNKNEMLQDLEQELKKIYRN